MQHYDINHCTAENVQEKRQKTQSNQQQANRLKFVLQKKTCQTCDQLTEIHEFDPKCHVLSQHVFFLLPTCFTDIHHFEKQTLLSSFQILMDYASLEVKIKKEKRMSEMSYRPPH